MEVHKGCHLYTFVEVVDKDSPFKFFTLFLNYFITAAANGKNTVFLE